MRTRFAPSPTGPLHLGHAYSAILAHDMARTAGGEFLLRIEDIDQSRARPEWEEQIYDDLRWLGLSWDGPVMRQSERMEAYRATLQRLWDRQWLYVCTCNRRDILEAASAPQEGITYGPDGVVYPGTCRPKWRPDDAPMPDNSTLRFIMNGWVRRDSRFEHRIVGPNGGKDFAHFVETGHAPDGQTGRIEFDVHDLPHSVGDVVLARKDIGTSYHLSVVLDDAAQDITHVVRGEDLFEATKIHVVLQRLLGLPTPVYHHHRLIRDEHGKRLAKRNDARAIRTFRDEGASPQDIRRMVGL
ncbi:MAG: tRNA glutamyl-Q(34) synthetase GluQRS [Silicimonas sp.]|nr:tRNA glutamyl-Q(34) synthetase GluQRS [Silicimonas sp.]